MLPYLLLLAQAALTLASPTATVGTASNDETPSELLLRYHQELGSNQTEFSLSTPDKKDVYAHACDNTFEILEKTVTMNVNQWGSGNLVVDDKTYKVLGDREMSGGISCNKLYDDESTVVECSIPWRHGFEKLQTLDGDVEECFSGEAAERRRSLPGPFSAPFSSASSDLVPRQDMGCKTWEEASK